MIEQLKDLTSGTTINFDNEDIAGFTEVEQMNVTSVELYSIDDNEIVVVELDEFYIVAHNFDTEPRIYLYQILDHGTTEDLENDGYYFLTEDQDFRSKIVNRDDTRSHIYKHSEVGAVYYMSDSNGDCETSICEYICNSHELANMLVIKKEEDELLILQGFEISADDISFETDVD
jgi:hypothetical protein